MPRAITPRPLRRPDEPGNAPWGHHPGSDCHLCGLYGHRGRAHYVSGRVEGHDRQGGWSTGAGGWGDAGYVWDEADLIWEGRFNLSQVTCEVNRKEGLYYRVEHLEDASILPVLKTLPSHCRLRECTDTFGVTCLSRTERVQSAIAMVYWVRSGFLSLRVREKLGEIAEKTNRKLKHSQALFDK